MNSIYGIPCHLRNRQTRSAIKQTLKQIRAHNLSDFRALQSLVKEIVPLPKAKQKDGTLGEWIEEQPNGDDPSTWRYGFDRTPGKLLLKERFENQEHAIATIAHEFGHACSTYEDEMRRGATIYEEWLSELAADWYACKKWGFGKLIARDWARREARHHCFKPGTSFEYNGISFRITRNFSIRPEPR